jgi:hypothetical protein
MPQKSNSKNSNSKSSNSKNSNTSKTLASQLNNSKRKLKPVSPQRSPPKRKNALLTAIQGQLERRYHKSP